jgi:zinc protease
VFFVDIPGAAQSQLYIGHPGPSRNEPDYEATRLMAAVLGGGFASRINMNIREDKGYAYGARAGFSYNKTGGTFAASSSVRTDATVPALREIVTEIRKIRSAPVEAEELERERDGTLLGLPAQFSTARRVQGTYANLVFFGLPLDYYEQFQARVRAATPADLEEAARKHLRDDGFKVLVVGDGATIRESLRALAAEEGLLGAEGFVELDGDGKVLRGAS